MSVAPRDLEVPVVTQRAVHPHVRTFLADALTPLAAYRRLAALSPVRFLLESVAGGERVSRYSFLGAAPRELLYVYTDRAEVLRPGGGAEHATHLPSTQRLPGPPLDALRERIGAFTAPPAEVPFTGGWVGFFGWDLVRLLEPKLLASRPVDASDEPVAVLARFDTVVVFDHVRQRVQAIANEVEGEVDRAAAEADLARIAAALTGDGGGGGVELPSQSPAAAPLPPANLDGAGYQAAVRRAQEHIVAGDIFQVVLARRFATATTAAPLALYRALRLVNPSPYMVLLELPSTAAVDAPPFALVGASPEMLVRVEGRRALTHPIAGTRPRGRSVDEDQRLAEELKRNEKERAEHLMLVDLGRNDLGRVAAPGTVRVASFMEVERYSHVMHLVSSVVG
ncbi:MAG TPA: chorismate-binding protein, partial [Thermoanaerobaculia bacterium]|nr:chorismate-binding protein [Thermoanaerobaculia bacterium]